MATTTIRAFAIEDYDRAVALWNSGVKICEGDSREEIHGYLIAEAGGAIGDGAGHVSDGR